LTRGKRCYNIVITMIQKVVQIGNSIGVVIPQSLASNTLKIGDIVHVDKDPVSGTYFINKTDKGNASSITPEFLFWLKKFNKKYKIALAELAKK